MPVPVAVQAALAFTWLGLVLGVSFLEAPIKFRAPGITTELGVGIGRLVFRALNLVEAVVAVGLVAASIARGAGADWWAVGGLCVVLALGAAVVRPLMDRRVLAGRTASAMPRHLLHVGYVGLELIKVVLLVLAGVLALVG